MPPSRGMRPTSASGKPKLAYEGSWAVLSGNPDRLIEGNGLTDLATGVGRVVLLVDRRSLDLEEEALPVVEQVDRLVGHRGEARFVRRPLVLGAGGRCVPLAKRGGGTAPLERHVAAVEQS